MTFALDFIASTEGGESSLHSLGEGPDEGLAELVPIVEATGRIAVAHDGGSFSGQYDEPMVRLVDLWLRKLPWVIGGDTETVTLRNSEHCFAFVPAGESVEVSFFSGTETEVEEYLLEPVTVRRDQFVGETLRLGEQLWAVCGRIDSRLPSEDDQVRDLGTSLSEARRAWHEVQIHQRR